MCDVTIITFALNSPYSRYIREGFNDKSLKESLSSSGQHSQQPEAIDSTQTPRSGLFNVLRASSEPDIRDIKTPSASLLPGRPRDGLPDGASDTAQPITTKDITPREFTPILGKLSAMDNSDCRSPGKKHFTPERDYGNSPAQRTEVRATKAHNMAGPALKRAIDVNSEHDTSVPLDEKDRQRTYAMHERVFKHKPLAPYKRSAPSPAFSTKSYDSDQYSELPTVIHVSRRESSGSKDSNSSIPSRASESKDATISPIRHPDVPDIRSRPSAESRITKLVSREKRVNGSPSLPSKPRIDVRAKRVQKS